MKSTLLTLFLLSLTLTGSFAQRTCGTMEYLEQQLQQNPAQNQRPDQLEKFTNNYVKNVAEKVLANGVLTIPVILHIVYNPNTPEENISDAQIASQMDILNEDFRRLNADAANTPNDFLLVAADGN